LAELRSDPLQRSLPGGTVPEPVVVRTEEHWVKIMVAMLTIMMLIIVLISLVGAGITGAASSRSSTTEAG
jgi:hypothetical protein